MYKFIYYYYYYYYLYVQKQGILTIQSGGGIFPPALLLAPPALWHLLTPHQCFALFSYGSLRTSNMSKTCDLRGLCHRLTLGLGGPLTHISTVGCFIYFDVQQYIQFA